MFLDQEQNEGGAAGHGPEERKREAQAPLLLHDMQTPEEAFGLPPERRRPHQLAVAALLLAGAVACIFAMRQFGLGPSESLAGIDVEYQPGGTSGPAASQVLRDLERSRKAVQVSADHIKQDPFELVGIGTELEEIDPDALSRAERARREEQTRAALVQRQKTLEDAFSKLHLQSVMQGAVPVARISDQIVKAGMKVGEHFMVSAIEGRQVTLTADGMTFVLEMEQSDGPARPGGKR
jgi:hypothetical protein